MTLLELLKRAEKIALKHKLHFNMIPNHDKGGVYFCWFDPMYPYRNKTMFLSYRRLEENEDELLENTLTEVQEYYKCEIVSLNT